MAAVGATSTVRYTVVLVYDPNGGYVVRVPALRGCVTEGNSLPEALHNAREAIAAYLDSLTRDGHSAPEDARVIHLEEDDEEALIVRVPIRGAPGIAN